MKKNDLSIVTRISLVLCSICMIIVLFVPMWRIDLNAPQYPEGLSLKIYAYDIKGNVDIINGLNHYIGMKSIHKADFIEFTVLPYCILFYSLLFMAAAFANNKIVYYIAFFLFVSFGIIAMVDFWKWEYNYGHDLNPGAAIIVPGMAYQPPLIGFKQLLNFGAYSMPAVGGWIFIGCGISLLLGVLRERKILQFHKIRGLAGVATLSVILMFCSCKSQPEPIKIGRDVCAYCKMTISDPRFGGEIITGTGKVYKFDDIRCLQEYVAAQPEPDKTNEAVYLCDFSDNHNLLPANSSFILKSRDLKCPMAGQSAAFGNRDSLELAMKVFQGEIVSINFR